MANYQRGVFGNDGAWCAVRITNDVAHHFDPDTWSHSYRRPHATGALGYLMSLLNTNDGLPTIIAHLPPTVGALASTLLRSY